MSSRKRRPSRRSSSRRGLSMTQRHDAPSRLRGWLLALVVAMTCVGLAGTALIATPLGQQLRYTFGFVLGWHHIGQQQQQLIAAIITVCRDAGLPATAYQRGETIVQRRGSEKWFWQFHSIDLPATMSPKTVAVLLQEVAEHLRFVVLERRQHSHPTRISVEMIFGMVGVATDFLVISQEQPMASTPSIQSVTVSLPKSPAISPPRPSPLPLPPSSNRPASPLPSTRPPVSRMALVIDDVGWELPSAQTLIRMDVALSFAILPETPYGMLIAQEAQRHQRDVLLHLPMEPYGASHIQLGPFALRSTMDSDQIAAQINAALAALPTVVGVNNHMGSLFTENRSAMRTTMRVLKQHNLFFLDSRTSTRSLAYDIARDMGVPAAQRHVFLDHDIDPDKIFQQLQRLVDIAQERGSAIGIGHPYTATLQVLRQHLAPYLSQHNVEIVPVSQLVE